MRKLIFLTFLILGISTTAFATEQILVAGSDDTQQSTNTEYLAIAGNASLNQTNWTTGETNRRTVIPTAGVLSELRVEATTGPGTGNTRVYTVMIDGGATALACTLSAAETNCNSAATTLTVSANEAASLRNAVTSAPVSTGDAHWSLKFTPTTSKETIIMGGSAGASIGTTSNVRAPMHGLRPSVTSSTPNTSVRFPTAGTLENMYIKVETAPGAGTTRVFQYGSVDCTISNAETECNSDTDTQAVVAGEDYWLEIDVTGTPAASQGEWGVQFTTTTDGEFVIAMSTNNAHHGSSTEYSILSAGQNTWSGTITNSDNLMGEMTISDIYVKLDNDPSSGDSYAYTLMQDAGATLLTCTISNTETECNGASDISISNDELGSTRVVPTSNPDSADAQISYLGKIAVGGGGISATGTIVEGGSIFEGNVILQ